MIKLTTNLSDPLLELCRDGKVLVDGVEVGPWFSVRQIRDYLALFPAVRLLLLARARSHWLAVPAHRGDSRIQVEGPVRVHLATGVEPFQQVIARFDGAVF